MGIPGMLWVEFDALTGDPVLPCDWRVNEDACNRALHRRLALSTTKPVAKRTSLELEINGLKVRVAALERARDYRT